MSVFIAAPYTRPFTGTFIDSLLYSRKPTLFKWQRHYGSAVDIARNALTLSFQNDPDRPEFLLFADNDATFHPESIYRMMMHDLPMVCACMYTRDLPPSPTWGKYLGKSKDDKFIYSYGKSAVRVVQKFRSYGIKSSRDMDPRYASVAEVVKESNAIVLPQTKQDLFEIDGCGMHFTLIRRDVIEKVGYPWFIDKGMTGAGEDFYFCRKVKDLGYPIYVDESIHTGHSVGEERDFGIRQLLDYSQYVEDLNIGIADDMGTYEMQ